MFGAASLEHQRRAGSRDRYAKQRAATEAPAGLGSAEQAFLRARDSVYVSSIGQNGWPYVQHRGGVPGFIEILDDTHLAWAEQRGNKQYVTAGNLGMDDRLAIIAVDYPRRQRLKLVARAAYVADPPAELRERISPGQRCEAAIVLEVVAFSWNCPKHITPRFTAAEIEVATEPLRARIVELEQQLAAAGVPPSAPDG